MVTVIIPTYNEAGFLEPLISFLRKNAGSNELEIIIADGGSTDETLKEATNAGAIVVRSKLKSRAAQMNFAALQANGSVLYFVHADSFPPATFIEDINDAIKAGYKAGRYQTRFISKSLLLKLNAYFTRFDMFACYGGDQTLFVCRTFFVALGGFDETKLIMEDYDITNRIKANKGRYKIFNKKALVSARKYDHNKWLTVQKANYLAVKMYKRGIGTAEIAMLYKQMLKF